MTKNLSDLHRRNSSGSRRSSSEKIDLFVSAVLPSSILNRFLNEQRCQETEYICLQQSVEDIEIKTEYQRHDCRNAEYDQFHDNVCAQNVAEKSHT